MTESSKHSDWMPTAGWDAIRLRADVQKKIRTFFDQRGFLEVETPILSVDTVVDRHLDPIGSENIAGVDAASWMQTSPEFHMKRLMASGGSEIFQLSKVFRQGERGNWHNPEFTMLEWYRAGDDMQAGINLLGELASELLEQSRPDQISYRDVFSQRIGIDPLLSNLSQLSGAAKSNDIQRPWSDEHDNRDDWLDLLFAELVQPELGAEHPIVVFDWPASQSALAVVRDEHPPVAERFELYYRGVELANGYHELTDADELLRRNRVANDLRIADGKDRLPEDSRMVDAMRAGLPNCAGVAMGIDRLLMLLMNTDDIADVLAFPIERA